MNFFNAFCVCVLIFNSIENGALQTRGPVWGNTSGSYLFQDRVSKGAIPLFRRSATIEYPVTHPDAKGKPVLHTIRGIEHVNFVNKEETGCDDPIVKIKEGGIYYPNAEIEVTSRRGCPLDSVVYFFGRF
ncbi:hypothetical protein Bhyg_05141 [Pseudolycoriella hygida]|uniref:Uncharacterized protein n=1 Tax=Pseudolycoriella hygida TaxID=35572 RepID=A0A9Q0SAJ6_9DIPT|nr:hypothetical protein Bhyg_05141 [Pseudolycoriella hygida]